MAKKFYKIKKTRNFFVKGVGVKKIHEGSVLTEKEASVFGGAVVAAHMEVVSEAKYKELASEAIKEKMTDEGRALAELKESLTADFEKQFKLQAKENKELKAEIEKLKPAKPAKKKV